MGNCVIVAIPDKNDRVWKISSEKVPHLTLLFLGDVGEVSNLDQIMLFVEHAANTTLKRFYLPVDRRGELGEDQADVLFFKKNRYDYKAIHDFRAALLKDNNIRTAYDSATQFEGPWQPHLTLGYPADPAKKEKDDYGEIYAVDFNTIAVWTGASEGPEWLLKDCWDEMEALATVPMAVAMSTMNEARVAAGLEALEHVGVKGMKWGHRKSDAAWQRKSLGVKFKGKHRGVSKAQREIGAKANKATIKGLRELDKQPEFVAAKKNGDLKNPKSEAYQKYDKAGFNIWSSEMKKATENYKHRVSPSEKKELTLRITENTANREASTWSIGIKERAVQHADNDSEIYTVRVIRDADGLIVDLEVMEDEMTQTTDMGSEFVLEHFGTKGMKWGVRKEDLGGTARSVGRAAQSTGGKLGKAAGATSRFVQDVSFENRVESGKAREAVVSSAQKPFRKEDLPAVKARHGDYAKLTNRAKKPFSKEARAYRKDARETYIQRLETTANSMKNASGTRQYTIRERGIDQPASGGALPTSKTYWDVSARNVEHAAADDFTRLELIMDDEGYIVDLKQIEIDDSIAQSAEMGAEFVLEHFGVKGMKWGHRKVPPVAVPTSATSHVPHGTKRKTQVKAEGGENHPAHDDAVKVAEARVKLKKSGTAALSNKELRELKTRLELENQVKQLTTGGGQKFVTGLLRNQGQQSASRVITKKAVERGF